MKSQIIDREEIQQRDMTTAGVTRSFIKAIRKWQIKFMGHISRTSGIKKKKSFIGKYISRQTIDIVDTCGELKQMRNNFSSINSMKISDDKED